MMSQTDDTDTITLIGAWAFRLDPDAIGEREGWQESPMESAATIQVPGVWQAQGFGEPRDGLRHDYQGKAWYQRTMIPGAIPDAWRHRAIRLEIGGALRRTRAFVNGKLVGESRLITASFSFDVTDAVRFDDGNLIAIEVDNLPRSGRPYIPSELPDLREWDFSEPIGAFNGVNNWGGLYRPVQLRVTNETWVEHVHIRPDIEGQCIHVEPSNGAAEMSVMDAEGREVGRVAPSGEPGEVVRIDLPKVRLWSPEDPYLYTLRLPDRQVRFGMRQVTTSGTTLRLNNRPYYLRGYSVGRADPIEGMQRVDKQFYLDQFRMAKSYGFNYGRWHSTTLPPEAFEAADEIGFLIHVELPVVFAGFLMPHIEQLHEELTAVLLEHRNHPSLLALAFGNEFNVDRDFETLDEKHAFFREIQRLYDYAKALAPDTLIMANNGYCVYPSDMMASYAGFVDDRPTVRHESGAYRASLPSIDLAEQFTGALTGEKLLAKRE